MAIIATAKIMTSMISIEPPKEPITTDTAALYHILA